MLHDRKSFIEALAGALGTSLFPRLAERAVSATSTDIRVLIIGESILNSEHIAHRISMGLRGGVVERWTYGGSQSPMGLLLLATDARGWLNKGNLLDNTNISHWGTRADVSPAGARSPSGQSFVRLSAAGINGQRVNGNPGKGALIVPAGAPDMVYSIESEPGTIAGFRLGLYNLTRRAVILLKDFIPDQINDLGRLPTRYVLYVTRADGAGYSAGDTLLPYIYVGPAEGNPAGDLYVRNPMINAGALAAPYTATAGTAQSVVPSRWIAPSPAIQRQMFDLVVVQFGRNDAGAMPAVHHEKILSAMIASGAAFGANVLVCTPPQLPQTIAHLSWSMIRMWTADC